MPAIYPSWVYKPGAPPRLVQTAADHAALGPGWTFSPLPVKE